MENKIYVDSEGKYLGEFSPITVTSKKGVVSYQDNPAVPEVAIEVSERPESGLQIYDLKKKCWIDSLESLKQQKIRELHGLTSKKVADLKEQINSCKTKSGLEKISFEEINNA